MTPYSAAEVGQHSASGQLWGTGLVQELHDSLTGTDALHDGAPLIADIQAGISYKFYVQHEGRQLLGGDQALQGHSPTYHQRQHLHIQQIRKAGKASFLSYLRWFEVLSEPDFATKRMKLASSVIGGLT